MQQEVEAGKKPYTETDYGKLWQDDPTTHNLAGTADVDPSPWGGMSVGNGPAGTGRTYGPGNWVWASGSMGGTGRDAVAARVLRAALDVVARHLTGDEVFASGGGGLCGDLGGGTAEGYGRRKAAFRAGLAEVGFFADRK